MRFAGVILNEVKNPRISLLFLIRVSIRVDPC